jgi:cell division protein FtsA
MSERYIVAIEIGSSKIRGAVAVVDDAGMVDVIAAEEEKLIDSVRYGCIQNVDVSNAISNVCERLEGYPRLREASIIGAYVGLGGKSLSSRIIEVSTSLPDEMEITAQLVADLKAKAESQVDENRDVVDVVPVRFTVDNKVQVNPVGSYGKLLGARMATFSCIPQIKRMLRRVLSERLGLNICGYVVRPLAEAAMALTDDERRLGCMFVDFGAETTTVSIYKNGAPVYMVTLPMGSRNITIDLTALNYIEERAEEIKRISGNAMPQEGIRRQGADGIDYTEVNNYVHARAAEIVQNILAQIEYAGLKATDLPGGIIIVGGGARLRGFNDLLSKQGKMKVRMGSVQGPIRISDNAHPTDTLDVISILLAASKMPEDICVEFPPEEDDENDQPAGDNYQSMYENEGDDMDESESRIGREYDDDIPTKPKKPKKSKKQKDEEEEEEEDHGAKGHSIFKSLADKLSGLFGDPDDSFN